MRDNELYDTLFDDLEKYKDLADNYQMEINHLRKKIALQDERMMQKEKPLKQTIQQEADMLRERLNRQDRTLKEKALLEKAAYRAAAEEEELVTRYSKRGIPMNKPNKTSEEISQQARTVRKDMEELVAEMGITTQEADIKKYGKTLNDFRNLSRSDVKDLFNPLLVELRFALRDEEAKRLSAEQTDKHKDIISRIISIRNAVLEIPLKKADKDNLQNLFVLTNKKLPEAVAHYRNLLISTGKPIMAAKQNVDDGYSFSRIVRDVLSLRDKLVNVEDAIHSYINVDTALFPEVKSNLREVQVLVDMVKPLWDKAVTGNNEAEDGMFLIQAAEDYIPSSVSLYETMQGVSEDVQQKALQNLKRQFELIALRAKKIVRDRELRMLALLEDHTRVVEEAAGEEVVEKLNNDPRKGAPRRSNTDLRKKSLASRSELRKRQKVEASAQAAIRTRSAKHIVKR